MTPTNKLDDEREAIARIIAAIRGDSWKPERIDQYKSWIDELLAREKGKVLEARKQALKETNGIAGALTRFAERSARKQHKHWYLGIDKNDNLTLYSEVNGKYLTDAVRTTIESIKHSLLKQKGQS